MTEVNYAIRAVARFTGLSAHVIRVWEKRYGAVEPERTDTNRRLYSAAQVERLTLLRKITQAGHSIGNVAPLPTEKLRQLAEEAEVVRPSPVLKSSDPADFLEACITAVKELNSTAMEATLTRAATELGAQGLLQRLVAPLAQRIGDLWRDGAITASHEHFASGIIRVFLGHAARTFAGTENAPIIVVATPAGQLHELGALLAAAAAANLGWRVIYLGASLPAAEIAGAVRQGGACAVALSLVYPEDDPGLERELRRLRESMAPETNLLVGGRAVGAYHDVLQEIDAIELAGLPALLSTLDTLRRPAHRKKP